MAFSKKEQPYNYNLKVTPAIKARIYKPQKFY